MVTMRAAVYHGTRDIRVEDVDVPAPGPGEVLLEVHAAGICGTDAAEWDHGPMMLPVLKRNPRSGHLGPIITGHEFGGRVVASGPGVNGFGDGTLVASGAGISCGRCAHCRRGLTNFCDHYFTVGLQCDGALAQYVAVPASICLPVGDLGLDDVGAALVQPMAIALHSLRQGDPSPGDLVAVFGIGGVGAFLVHAAAHSGARVVAVDLDPGRLAVATALGAEHVVLADREEPLAAQVAAVAGPYTVAYEVTGAEQALAAAVELAAPRGRIVAVGLGSEPVPLDVRRLTLSELRLVGTNAHVFAADFGDAARVLAGRSDGWADVAPVALPLDRLVDQGLRPMVERRSERIKTLIDPWSTDVYPLVDGSAVELTPTLFVDEREV
jgi:(R,R)-butanediol dehydrogenase/meso-butanediol dehydrogenase/diacetyl reductase